MPIVLGFDWNSIDVSAFDGVAFDGVISRSLGAAAHKSSSLTVEVAAIAKRAFERPETKSTGPPMPSCLG